MPSTPTLPPAQLALALELFLRRSDPTTSSLNGPEPSAVVSIVFAAIALAGTTAALIVAMATRIGASGWLRWNTAVVASGVSIEAIERKFERAAAAVSSSSRRSNEAFTSAEVTCAPSENFALGLSLKVSVRPSAENSQLSAIAGTTLRLGSSRTSGS